MGITDLNKLLKENSPSSFSTQNLSLLAGKRVGVDVFQWLFRFLRAVGDEGVLGSFLVHICTLRKHGALPFCVFDGLETPKEKDEERKKRKEQKELIIAKKNELKKLLETLGDSDEVDESLQENARKSLQKKKYASVDLSDEMSFRDAVAESIAIYEKQTAPLTKERIDSVREMLDVLGIRHITAPGEADCLLSSLAIHGKVFAVCTSDTDVHAYGVPFAIPDIDISKGTMTLVHREQYLSDLGLTDEQFLDLCIMCGCDYNDRAKIKAKTEGKRPRGIGWKTAFSLIKKYGNIEKLEDIDISPLCYKRCRDLFSSQEVPDNIPPGSRPTKEKLEEFLLENSVRVDADYIMNCWRPVPV